MSFINLTGLYEVKEEIIPEQVFEFFLCFVYKLIVSESSSSINGDIFSKILKTFSSSVLDIFEY